MKLIVSLLVFFVLLCSVSANAQFAEAARAVLSDGRMSVDLMVNRPPPEAAQIALRLKAAAAKDPTWIEKALKSSEPGRPLAYDPRMGITKDEYATFLAAAKSIKAVKAGESWVEIYETGPGRYTLLGGPGLQMLTGVKVDFQNEKVVTPIGTFDKAIPIDAPRTTSIGEWKGVQWKFDENPGQVKGTTAQFALGLRTVDSTPLLSYRVFLDTAEGHVETSILLYFKVANTSEIKK